MMSIDQIEILVLLFLAVVFIIALVHKLGKIANWCDKEKEELLDEIEDLGKKLNFRADVISQQKKKISDLASHNTELMSKLK